MKKIIRLKILISICNLAQSQATIGIVGEDSVFMLGSIWVEFLNLFRLDRLVLIC